MRSPDGQTWVLINDTDAPGGVTPCGRWLPLEKFKSAVEVNRKINVTKKPMY